MGRDERVLVRQCLDRDQAACASLVEAHARMVGTVIWLATGDGGVVEDLTQEVFLRVFRALPYFNARAKLSTWIFTITHRVVTDHIRAASRRPLESRTGRNDSDALDLVPAPNVPDPESEAIREEARRLVHDGLTQLPEKYRLPLAYAAIDGLDYGTIAEMLGVPLGTVKTLVFRGKRLLKAWIATELEARVTQRKVSDAL